MICKCWEVITQDSHDAFFVSLSHSGRESGTSASGVWSARDRLTVKLMITSGLRPATQTRTSSSLSLNTFLNTGEDDSSHTITKISAGKEPESTLINLGPVHPLTTSTPIRLSLALRKMAGSRCIRTDGTTTRRIPWVPNV